MAVRPDERCIVACKECEEACLQCAGIMAQLEPGSRCEEVCLECAAVCRQCVDAIEVGSGNAADICRDCIDICAACAEECGRHGDIHCIECAEACQACIEACRALVLDEVA
jgi:hypothetical protein